MIAAESLESLLSQTVEEAERRQALTLQTRLPDLSRIALFGAGNMGRGTLARLRANGVEPVAFIDDTPSKHGAIIDGLVVLSLTDATASLGPDVVVIVTILNPRLTYRRAADLLQDRGLPSASLMHLSWLFPDAFRDLVNTTSPAHLVAHRAAIESCRTIWADPASAEVLDEQLLWRLTLDPTVLSEPHLEDIYFPADIDLQIGDDTTFIDAGAYDGDSAVEFLRHTAGRFRQLVAIEPDPSNFAGLVKTLESHVAAGRAVCFNGGVGDRDAELRFNASGDMSAALDDAGDRTVQVRPLESFLPPDGEVYAKFDIEGAEWPTLVAARDLIARRRPKLAVSVYHDPSDLWRIPLLIRDYLPGAKLHLRAHGVDGTDVVLYAV